MSRLQQALRATGDEVGLLTDPAAVQSGQGEDKSLAHAKKARTCSPLTGRAMPTDHAEHAPNGKAGYG